MVAADGSERGLECSGPMVEAGEGPNEDEKRMEEDYSEIPKDSNYENWEDSYLKKFSEFLGFSTKGFEKEILELIRNLVAKQ